MNSDKQYFDSSTGRVFEKNMVMNCNAIDDIEGKKYLLILMIRGSNFLKLGVFRE